MGAVAFEFFTEGPEASTATQIAFGVAAACVLIGLAMARFFSATWSTVASAYVSTAIRFRKTRRPLR